MHQPYHAHPLLPPWQIMDYNARERSPAMPLHSLWEYPDIVEVRIRLWEKQQEAAGNYNRHVLLEKEGLMRLQRLCTLVLVNALVLTTTVFA